MKKVIKLNNEISIDLEKLIESRLLIQANSGGGKSWAIRRIIEQSFGKVQIIVIDPEGEFGNMRSELDFVYCGKGGDAPVESRSASLLAHRLLELKASAIVDLYELQPQERKHFVRLFCDSMVNAPKELWHDVLIIIDEAHVFAPEKGESEAMGSVIDLATRGRKRGYCVVLATQRLPKLNKDAAAECNNKLIGRASQDIDRKRASEELGFTTKEQILSLRDLNPGEFYTFGPAISRDVIKTTIGDVSVKPAKRGIAKNMLPAPSEKVKSILAKLADLPQEAEKEAKTVAELKKENATLKRDLTVEKNRKVNLGKTVVDLDWTESEVKKAIEKRDKEWLKKSETWKKYPAQLEKIIQEAIGVLQKSFKFSIPHQEVFGMPIIIDPTKKKDEWEIKNIGWSERGQKLSQDRFTFKKTPEFKARVEGDFEQLQLNQGERKVLNAIAQYPEGVSKAHLYVLTGYRSTSLVVYSQKLTQKGYAEKTNDGLKVTQAGIDALGDDFKPLPEGPELREHLLDTLLGGEKRVFAAIIEGHEITGEGVTKEWLMERTGYKSTSITVYLQKLSARKVITSERGVIRISEKLL